MNEPLNESAGRCSAELHSAVSQIFNLRPVEMRGGCRAVGRSAECNSAIRQIKNLRYGADQRPQQLEWMIRQAKSLVGQAIPLSQPAPTGGTRQSGGF